MLVNPAIDRLNRPMLEARASELLRDYQRRFAPITAPPVPVEKIADLHLGLSFDWLTIPDDDRQPILGYIQAGAKTICLNERRQDHFDQFAGSLEFTIAHEVGHYLMHLVEELSEPLPLASGQSVGYICRHITEHENAPMDWREWQANVFASYLLMPHDLLIPAFQRVDLTWDSLYQLRDQFQVSISALTKRLQELNLLYIEDKRLYRSEQEAKGQVRLL